MNCHKQPQTVMNEVQGQAFMKTIMNLEVP